MLRLRLPASEGQVEGGKVLSAMLDTSLLSQTRKAAPDAGTMRWLQAQSTSSLFLSAITIHEVRQVEQPGKSEDLDNHQHSDDNK